MAPGRKRGHRREAYAIAQAVADREAARGHAALVTDVGRSRSFWRDGADGCAYQVVVRPDWDGRPGETIRVWVHVDDGGWRALLPWTVCVLVKPGQEPPLAAYS